MRFNKFRYNRPFYGRGKTIVRKYFNRGRSGGRSGSPSKKWLRTVFWSIVGGLVLMAIAPGLRNWVMRQTQKAGIAA